MNYNIALRILAVLISLSCNMREKWFLMVIYAMISGYLYRQYLVYFLIVHVILRVPCVPIGIIGK